MISFFFPEIFQSELDSTELTEKIDYKIRYSALPLGLAMYLLLFSWFSYQERLVKFGYLLLFIDLGYLITRLFSMSLYGFGPNDQLIWLGIEIVIALVLVFIIKLKKAPPKT
jgi:hypothetical protein